MRASSLLRFLAAGVVALAAAPPQQWPVFTDITKEAGITFKHSYGDHDLDNIVEGTGAGACVFDYDGDGFLDIYFVTGRGRRASATTRAATSAAS